MHSLYTTERKAVDNVDKKSSREKVAKVMREFKKGKLRSSSGDKVTSRKQAIAIGLSEAGMAKAINEGVKKATKKAY